MGMEPLSGCWQESEGAEVDAVQPRRWTRQEYEQLGELGVLGPDEHVELIGGEIVQVPPQQSRHATGVCLAEEALRVAFGAGVVVRVQLPLALGQYSEPEPDVAVVAGSLRDFVADHPTSALLVVEIAEATLSFDRNTKASLYAAAGIPEYWIVNLVHRQLEMHREPGPMPEARFDFGYRVRTIALPGEEVDVPGTVGSRLAVDDLLP
jgi:Uma2 family endonuclease